MNVGLIEREIEQDPVKYEELIEKSTESQEAITRVVLSLYTDDTNRKLNYFLILSCILLRNSRSLS